MSSMAPALRPLRRALVKMPFGVFLLTGLALAACRDNPAGPAGDPPLPPPELTYLGFQEGSGAPGINTLWVRMTNFGAYAFELFAEAPDLPPCGLNHRAGRTWILMYSDGNCNYGYCYGYAAPPLPRTMELVVFAPELEPLPARITVELWDRATGRRVSTDVAVEPGKRFP